MTRPSISRALDSCSGGDGDVCNGGREAGQAEVITELARGLSSIALLT